MTQKLTILFDLDGTLVDTAPDLMTAHNHVMNKFGYSSKTMDEIKVVPNPYVATNVMEPAVSNQFLNQRRQLMFTNIPAKAVLKIFTISGILIREIKINNSPERGIVHWDMLTKEGLEIAAGMYLYHVEAETGEEKIGKFAVIK